MDTPVFNYTLGDNGKSRFVEYKTSPDGPIKKMEVTDIEEGERRIPEVAFVNHQRAPELLAAFNVAYLVAARVLTQLEYEHVQAKIILGDIRGIILLDRAAGVLAAKGLTSDRNPAGSMELRQAVVDTDKEYRAQQDICNQLACARDLFENKKKGLEMAYTSVKKIIGETLSPYGAGNPRLSTPVHGDAPSGDRGIVLKDDDSDTDFDNFFGKAK